jgi:hypothetical protein
MLNGSSWDVQVEVLESAIPDWENSSGMRALVKIEQLGMLREEARNYCKPFEGLPHS